MQKFTPFWHKMLKIAYDAPPDPLVVRGFLPSAIAASRFRRLHFPQISQDLSPQSYIQIFASATPSLYLDVHITCTLSQGRPSPSETMMHFFPCFRFPQLSKNVLTLWKNVTILPFPDKFSDFHPQNIS